MRDNAFTQRGGDTVVLEKLSQELRALGHTVVIDLECKEDLSQYDIAHLFNFATALKLQRLAKHCVTNKAKFVVTTLYEDWSKFFNPMIIQEMLLSAYVKCGQPANQWERHENTALESTIAPKQDNTYSALAAQILVSSGFEESVTLRRDYPDCGPVEICHFGSEISTYSDRGRLFRDEYGVDNFVLCVGRLEQRKNQLSLLKALEDSDATLVFATGGFSYEKNYVDTCKSFKRQGRTIFLDRISSELLTSCFEAAAVHALPSWYELPGLVSIEAAGLGTPCVVTDNGTIRDYLGDSAYYCNPGSTLSIRAAVDRALNVGKINSPRADISSFTWAKSALKMVDIYKKAIELPLTERNLEEFEIDENKIRQEEIEGYKLMESLNPNVTKLIKLIR